MPAPDPRPPEPAIQSAARLLAEGRPAEAAARLAELVAVAPTYAAAHVLRATALEAAGHIDDALVSWGRAAALVPRSPLVHRERERLLATHVAGEIPVDLPPPVPAAPPPPPDAPPPAEPPLDEQLPLAEVASLPPADLGLGSDLLPEAPVTEEADDLGGMDPEVPDLDPEDDAAQPLLDFGALPPAHPLVDAEAPQALDASDLLFGDVPLPPPAEDDLAEQGPSAEAAPAVALPESPVEASEAPPPEPPPSEAPPLSPLRPISADWGAEETGLAPVVPPEGDLPPLASPAEPPTDPFAGWDILTEATIPTPPPGAFAEPDIVAPEERETPDEVVDPFGDIEAIVDEFSAPPPAEPPSAESPSAPPAEAPPWGEPPPAGPSVADELDALIAQLEDAPRIRPDPEYRGPEEPLDAGDVDDMVSETLAKIYAAQHQYVEAALVYEKLAARQPDDADALLERAAELRQRGA